MGWRTDDEGKAQRAPPRTWNRFEARIVDLALEILRAAASRSSRGPVQCVEVRLALHVLRPSVFDRRLLVGYWEAASVSGSHPWLSCHLPYRWIADHLSDRGCPISDANRP